MSDASGSISSDVANGLLIGSKKGRADVCGMCRTCYLPFEMSNTQVVENLAFEIAGK